MCFSDIVRLLVLFARLSASSDGFISHADKFSESYPSVDVRESPPLHPTLFTDKKTVAVV